MTTLSLIKSRWFRIASVSVILCLVVLLGTPLLARYLAQQWLLENGGEQVHFEDVDLNLFTGKLVLQGLEVKVDNETTLVFDTVGLDLEWWPLLSKQVDLQSLQLTGLRLIIDNLDPEAMRVGGIRLPTTAPDGEPPAKASSAWLSGIKALTLQDFHILIRDPQFELDVTLDYLRLTRMAQWAPEQAAVLELAGRINDAPVQISGQLAPFAEQPRYDLDLSVEKLQLGAFRKLASPPIDQLSGLLSYAGKLTFEQSEAALKLSQTGKIALESLRLTLSEPGLETSIGQFSHTGKLGFEQSGALLRFNEEGDIALESLRLAMSEAGVETSFDRFSHSGPLTFEQSETALKLSQAGKTAVESLRLALREQGLETSIGQFSHDGKLGFEQSDSLLTLNEEGGIAVASLHLAMSEAGLETSIEQFSHNGKLGFEQSGDALMLNEGGEIALESLSLAMSEPGLETSIGQFSHNGELAFGQSGESVSLEQDGAVSLGSLGVSLRQPALDIQNNKLELTARLKYSDSPSGAEMRLASDISMENLDVKASERKVSLVSAETLRIDELLFQAADQLSIKTISSEQIRVGKVSDVDAEKPQSLAYSDKLQIAGLSRAGNLVAIDSVAYEGFHNRIVRDKDGNLEVMRFIDIIENLNTPAATTEKTDAGTLEKGAEEEQAEPVDLVIGSIRASQGSSVTFIDDKVKPSFVATVIFKEISLEQLDTRKPEQKSPLRLDGAIGKYTRLSLSGDVKPFLKPVSVDLVGKIEALDLPALSSYTWESLGLQLDSGTLDADLKLVSKDELLDGKVDLVLHQLELGKVDSQSGLQSNIPVPLDTALSTLRDKNNTIKLTIPVEGNMNDPKFDASDAINQVLATAMKTGALSYLQHALQPFGTLIAAAQYAGEAITKVRLNPLEFEAGQATLTTTGEEYLAKVAKVMQERPEIAIKLCGVAVQQDNIFFQQQQQQDQPDQTAVADTDAGQPSAEAPAMDEQKLTDLAMLRADVVKDYLAEKHQVPASRLVGCRAHIELDPPDAKPRTDLLI